MTWDIKKRFLLSQKLVFSQYKDLDLLNFQLDYLTNSNRIQGLIQGNKLDFIAIKNLRSLEQKNEYVKYDAVFSKVNFCVDVQNWKYIKMPSEYEISTK